MYPWVDCFLYYGGLLLYSSNVLSIPTNSSLISYVAPECLIIRRVHESRSCGKVIHTVVPGGLQQHNQQHVIFSGSSLPSFPINPNQLHCTTIAPCSTARMRVNALGAKASALRHRSSEGGPCIDILAIFMVTSVQFKNLGDSNYA